MKEIFDVGEIRIGQLLKVRMRNDVDCAQRKNPRILPGRHSQTWARSKRKDELVVVVDISTLCLNTLQRYSSSISLPLTQNKIPLDFDVKILTKSGQRFWISTEEIIDIICQ
jgi:hypothetical protein